MLLFCYLFILVYHTNEIIFYEKHEKEVKMLINLHENNIRKRKKKLKKKKI